LRKAFPSAYYCNFFTLHLSSLLFVLSSLCPLSRLSGSHLHLQSRLTKGPARHADTHYHLSEGQLERERSFLARYVWLPLLANHLLVLWYVSEGRIEVYCMFIFSSSILFIFLSLLIDFIIFQFFFFNSFFFLLFPVHLSHLFSHSHVR
jgi:hypothetical protein